MHTLFIYTFPSQASCKLLLRVSLYCTCTEDYTSLLESVAISLKDLFKVKIIQEN